MNGYPQDILAQRGPWVGRQRYKVPAATEISINAELDLSGGQLRIPVFKFLEQLAIRCSDLTVGEDERSKKAEADDPVGSSMQADDATRSRSQVKRYRLALTALTVATPATCREGAYREKHVTVKGSARKDAAEICGRGLRALRQPLS